MTKQKPLVNPHQTTQDWVTEKLGTGNKTERQAETKPTGQQGRTRSKVFFFLFLSIKDSKKPLFFRHLHTYTKCTLLWAVITHCWTFRLLDSLNWSINAAYRKHSFTLKFITIVHSYISIVSVHSSGSVTSEDTGNCHTIHRNSNE